MYLPHEESNLGSLTESDISIWQRYRFLFYKLIDFIDLTINDQGLPTNTKIRYKRKKCAKKKKTRSMPLIKDEFLRACFVKCSTEVMGYVVNCTVLKLEQGVQTSTPEMTVSFMPRNSFG